MATCIIHPSAQTLEHSTTRNALPTVDRDRRRAPASIRAPRQRLIARIRHEITLGTYDTSDKLECALSRCLRAMEQENTLPISPA